MQDVSEDATLFDAMQSAVDIVDTSAHPTTKVAASLTGHDRQGRLFCTSRINDWPPAIETHFGRNRKVGDASGTVHAETACILQSPYTYAGRLCITDPFCPNCAKNMAEAGIAAIYIDHKGFDKDFAKRRGHHFESMSMEICAKAGIAIYEINRKQKTITPILEVHADYTPPLDNPAALERDDHQTYQTFIANQHVAHGARRKFACARVYDEQAGYYLGAGFHPVIGYTSASGDDLYAIANPSGKYSLIQEPVNRLLMMTARYGMTLAQDSLYCAHVPTARELVNCVGAGLAQITIGDREAARDNHALQALNQLETAGILTVIDG